MNLIDSLKVSLLLKLDKISFKLLNVIEICDKINLN